MLSLAAAVIMSGVLLSYGAPVSSSARPLDVCEVLRRPVSFNAKLISIRGLLKTTDHGAWIVGEKCPGILTTQGYVWRSILFLAYPNSADALGDVDFEYNREAFDRLTRQMEQRKAGYDRVFVTVVGILETRESLDVQVYRDASGKVRPAGFGHMAGAPAQIIVKTIKDPVFLRARKPEAQRRNR